MKYDKETILYGYKLFSHIIPKGKRLSNYQFANLIKENYSLNNPITKGIFDQVRNANNLYFETHKIVKI